MNIILCCGGRDYTDVARVKEVLDSARTAYPEFVVLQGGARGADRLCKDWAEVNGLPCIEMAAGWGYYGKKAGALRNSWMLLLKPVVVVAFKGGVGTANMIMQAKREGIPIYEA